MIKIKKTKVYVSKHQWKGATTCMMRVGDGDWRKVYGGEYENHKEQQWMTAVIATHIIIIIYI